MPSGDVDLPSTPLRDGRRDTVLALARSGSAALVSVVLPLAMTRLYDGDQFAVWTIALQAFLYTAFLEAGLTLAVSRTAAARPAGDLRVLRAGQRVATLPLGGAVVVYAVVVAALPRIATSLPGRLVGSARMSVALMALASLATIRSFAPQGFLMGSGRFARAIVPVVTGTAGAAIVAMAIARFGGDPVWSATGFAAVRIATALWLERAARLGIHTPRRHGATTGAHDAANAQAATTREVRSMVGTLWIWSFAGFLGTGLDLTLVSWADFGALRPYAISAALTSVLTGVAGAISTVVVPRVARARTETATADLVTDAARRARVDAFAIGCVAIPLVTGASVLAHTLGGRTDLTLVLLLGAWLRISMTPVVSAMVGAGDHRILRGSPIAEGAVNLALGLILAPTVGAIGVAAATAISGLLGVGLHLFRNIPRSSLTGMSPLGLLRRVHLPGVAVLASCAWIGGMFRTPTLGPLAALATTAALGAGVLFRFGLEPDERASVCSLRHSRAASLTAPSVIVDARR